jgi:hypothetical protein
MADSAPNFQPGDPLGTRSRKRRHKLARRRRRDAVKGGRAMIIGLTKDRLEEARFFLDELRQHKTKQARPNKPPPEHFRYYLNAFLNAARSVKLILKRQETKKYNAWIGSWEAQLTEAEDALVALAEDKRDTSVHEGLLETTIRSEEIPIPLSLDPYQVHALRAYSLSLRQGGGPRTISDVHYVQSNGSEQEVVAMCEQYVDLLARLVQDFFDKHPE